MTYFGVTKFYFNSTRADIFLPEAWSQPNAKNFVEPTFAIVSATLGISLQKRTYILILHFLNVRIVT